MTRIIKQTLNSRRHMAQTLIPSPRYIYVHSSEQISAQLQRVYFSSDDFSDLTTEQKGAHIKLFFPDQAHLTPLLPQRNQQGKIIWPEGEKPITRTYTIRDFLQDEQLLVVDFVRHADFGIAANWAIHAQPGHVIGLAGPGGRLRFNPNARYWVFIVDLSALPMLAASLELLPTDAQGEVWIEIDAEADQIDLFHPAAMSLNWLVKGADVELKIDASLERLDWESEQISVTLAGENQRVVSMLKRFKQKYQLNKVNLYAVPYWKKGLSEEAYHQERHQVIDDQD